MSDMTESRLGLVKDGNDAFALFLKTFSGEVLAAFSERNVMMPLHNVRTIQSGKSAQFPLVGTATAGYHAPGDEILGTAIDHSERVINIDNLLIAHAFIANIDEAMNHYDVRSIYSKELGYALANHADKAIIRSGLAGASDATDTLGKTGGVNLATGGTGSGVIDKILEAAQHMDEQNIPQGDRYCVLTPDLFYKVLQSAGSANSAGAVLNRDFGNGGSFQQGGSQILTVGGVQVMMSNHIPTGNENDDAGGTVDTTLGSTSVRNAPFNDASVTNADANEGYSGANFTNYEGLVFHRSGIGTVKLLDLAIESDYLVQNQGTLMVAKYAMGHNYLRPAACVGLKTS
tara:strand:+ start:5787 stop:6821 length:1035 start_codon:yes stop_codon:yes gene_type:complete